MAEERADEKDAGRHIRQALDRAAEREATAQYEAAQAAEKIQQAAEREAIAKRQLAAIQESAAAAQQAAVQAAAREAEAARLLQLDGAARAAELQRLRAELLNVEFSLGTGYNAKIEEVRDMAASLENQRQASSVVAARHEAEEARLESELREALAAWAQDREALGQERCRAEELLGKFGLMEQALSRKHTIIEDFRERVKLLEATLQREQKSVLEAAEQDKQRSRDKVMRAMTSWMRSTHQSLQQTCLAAWRTSAVEERQQRAFRAATRESAQTAMLSMMALNTDTTLQLCVSGWRDTVLRNAAEDARREAVTARMIGLWAANTGTMAQQCIVAWSAAVKRQQTEAFGHERLALRVILQRHLDAWHDILERRHFYSGLSEARLRTIDWHARSSLRAAQHSIFRAWLTVMQVASEFLAEEYDRHQASLIETRRQAAAAREAAEEAARFELEQQRASGRTEARLQESELREEELGQQVDILKLSVHSRDARLAEYERRVREMEAEVGVLTSELLEERWQHAGARARLEGQALVTADSSLQRSGEAVQKWKHEHQRSMKAIVQEHGAPVVRLQDAPLMPSRSLSSLPGQCADEVDCASGASMRMEVDRRVRRVAKPRLAQMRAPPQR